MLSFFFSSSFQPKIKEKGGQKWGAKRATLSLREKIREAHVLTHETLPLTPEIRSFFFFVCGVQRYTPQERERVESCPGFPKTFFLKKQHQQQKRGRGLTHFCRMGRQNGGFEGKKSTKTTSAFLLIFYVGMGSLLCSPQTCSEERVFLSFFNNQQYKGGERL